MFLDTFFLWLVTLLAFFFLQILERERHAPPEDAARFPRIAFLLALGTERTAQMPALVTHIIKV